jgi:hypothetical protein
MSLRTRVHTVVLLAAAVTAASLLAAPAAQAAPRTAEAVSISAGRLVLEPGARGYRGSLPVTVGYRGTGPADLSFTFTEPVIGSYVDYQPEEMCWSQESTEGEIGRKVMTCPVPGGEVRPGETRSFVLNFAVLTTPQSHPMSVADRTITAQVHSRPEVGARVALRTVFRSTTGSVRHPVPYVQDTRSDITVTTGAATLARQADGSYAGRAPVTVRFGGDVPHWELEATFAVTGPVQVDGVEPVDVCAGTWCVVPGGKFLKGEVRTFDLLLKAPAGTPVGAVGTVDVTVLTNWVQDAEDIDPADNVSTITVDAA